MPEGKMASGPEQAGPRFTVADGMTLVRLPLAVCFVLFTAVEVRFLAVALAGLTDLLDGVIARRFGGSRLGGFLDPVTDKLFMAAPRFEGPSSAGIIWTTRPSRTPASNAQPTPQ